MTVALGGLKLGVAGAMLGMLTTSAFAADLGDVGLKDTPLAGDKLSWTANVGVTSDYIFRGISQNGRDPSGTAGVDLAYGMFYAGTSFEGVKFGNESAVAGAQVEYDLYAGIKPKLGIFTFDFGIVTYNYLNKNIDHPTYYDPTFQELKAGTSVTVLKDLALSGTVFYSWNYFGETGAATTVEGTASKPITKIAGVEVAASGTVGHTYYSDSIKNGFKNYDYTYGNVGLTGTYNAVSVDLRWWDTDLPGAACGTTVFQCGSAFVATLKITY
jgi:uncharacterized protein (TIGR02001 family)